MSDGSLKPQSERERDLLFEAYKPYQPVSVQISGGESARSHPESNLFHACCKLVSDRVDDDMWNTTERVKVQVKIALKFFKDCIWVDHDGSVHFELDTLKFDKTNQVRSHNFISDGMEILSIKAGMNVDELVEMAKKRMKSF